MKYTPSRRQARPPRLVEYPPSPVMLEIQAAGRHGNELLARYHEKCARDQVRSKKVGRVLLATVTIAVFGYHILHPEWPLSLLPSWFH